MRILILNQPFYPDVVSTAQHAADLAQALSERGHQVRVIASRRGYDNPEKLFTPEEDWGGVHISRVSSTGFGKGAKWRRMADFTTFLMNCSVAVMQEPRADVVVALTSPPLIAALGAVLTKVKGGRLVYWVMDLNPDQAIAAGWMRPDSRIAKLLSGLLRWILGQSYRVIVLDRFMSERIAAKGVRSEKLVTIPPWSHDEAVNWDPAGRESFRAAHGLTGKFVVMYSGNHSPCHPLDTMMQAALKLNGREDIAFCFVGGGTEHARVREFAATHQLSNILCLPYQPIEKLSASLSAADMHAVVMGDPFVGIVHPCKVYNIMRLDTPILYVGPPESHVTDLFNGTSDELLYQAVHGDVPTVLSHIGTAQSKQLRKRTASGAESEFSQQTLVNRLTQVLELCSSTPHPRPEMTTMAES